MMSNIKIKIKAILYFLLKWLPVQENKILFQSFNGNNYSCNTKYLYLAIKDKKKYKCVWIYNKDDYLEDLSESIIVKNSSIKSIYHYATSKHWIINCNLYPPYKPKKNQIYTQLWHGIPLKKIGMDIDKDISDKKIWIKDSHNWNYFISNHEVYNSIYEKAFSINKEKIISLGIPRNDIFNNDILKERAYKNIRNALGDIINNKKIILYAPTFRDDEYKDGNCKINIDFKKFNMELGEDYLLILKVHPNVAKMLDIKDLPSNVINASNYNDIQELLTITDILITDYSSVFFDFSLTGKPILFYCYDLEKYEKELRGFYFDFYNFVPGPILQKEDELYYAIKNIEDYNYYDVKGFSKKYNANSNENCIHKILEKLQI